MSLPGLLAPFTNDAPLSFEAMSPSGEGAPTRITARLGARPVYVASLWLRRNLPLLVITPRPDDSRRLHDQLLTYLGEDAPVYLLPEPEVLPFERLAVDARTGNQRLTALAALANCIGTVPDGDGQRPPLVVASVSASLRLTLSPEYFRQPGSTPTPTPTSMDQRVK